jgi:hypothetical protein
VVKANVQEVITGKLAKLPMVTFSKIIIYLILKMNLDSRTSTSHFSTKRRIKMAETKILKKIEVEKLYCNYQRQSYFIPGGY